MGTYLNWSIWKSDQDCAPNTVDNPVNNSTSSVLGGTGTAHLHSKIPTHHPPWMHYSWAMHNKPTEPNIYNINISTNLTSYDTYKFVTNIVSSDPDPVFINIHANNDPDTFKFGSINALLKWPTQYKIQQLEPYFKKLYNFNPFNCQNDLKLRKMTATNLESFAKVNNPLNQTRLRQSLQFYKQWYDIRHELQPHEINTDTYLQPKTYQTQDVMGKMCFEINCRDIPSEQFPGILKTILKGSGASDNFDTAYVEKFHHNYINAQKTLEWFPSIANWRATGKLSEFLTSHAYIEGLVINEMLADTPAFVSYINWDSSLEEINNKYQMVRLTQ
jgi:hypothetical protein